MTERQTPQYFTPEGQWDREIAEQLRDAISVRIKAGGCVVDFRTVKGVVERCRQAGYPKGALDSVAQRAGDVLYLMTLSHQRIAAMGFEVISAMTPLPSTMRPVANGSHADFVGYTCAVQPKPQRPPSGHPNQ